MTSSERQLEEELIEKLKALKYEYRTDIRDRAALDDYSHHRYDVILLINGVPVAQIELKTLAISPRRAIEQIVDYKNDPGNDYSRTLLCFVQVFIVSNRTETWNFANNNARHFGFNAVRTQRHGEHQAHHAAPSAGGSRRSAVLSTPSHSSLLGCAPVFGVEAGSSWADPRGPLNSYFKRTYGKTFSIVTVPPVKLRPAAPVCAPFFVRA